MNALKTLEFVIPVGLHLINGVAYTVTSTTVHKTTQFGTQLLWADSVKGDKRILAELELKGIARHLAG